MQGHRRTRSGGRDEPHPAPPRIGRPRHPNSSPPVRVGGLSPIFPAMPSIQIPRPLAMIRVLLAATILSPALAQAQSSGEIPPPQVERARPVDSARLAAINSEEFSEPPPEIARHVLAPRSSNISLSANAASPDRQRFLITRSTEYPTMADMAREHVFLGGLQVDTRANRARTLSIRGWNEMEILDARSGQRTRIQLPDGARASGATWSPDGRMVAFYASFNDASYLYVADASNGRTRRLTTRPLLATLVTSPAWSADGSRLLTVLVPSRRAALPVAPAVPTGPKVRVMLEGSNPTRTYASLLESAHDKALLEYYTTGQLTIVDAARGRVTEVGQPAMLRAIDLSPDGEYARVTLVEKPFSYFVPTSAFGTVDQLWDASGQVVATLGSREMRLGNSFGPDTSAADTARRNLAWSPDGQGFVYLQLSSEPDSVAADTTAQPAPDSARRTSTRRRDRVVQWRAPFGADDVTVLFETEGRLTNVLPGSSGDVLFVTERAGAGAASGTHTYAVFTTDPETRHSLYRTAPRGGNSPAALRTADSAFYADPGTLVTVKNSFGGDAVLMSSDGAHAYLEGVQYDSDPMSNPPRPFVDRIALRTGEKARFFESANDIYEQVVIPLDDDLRELITTRESPNTVPDAWRRDITAGTLTQLTENRDYSPEVSQLERRLIPVERVDGVTFWVKVTLPPAWDGERLPALFWFYPREFTDQEAYDRSRRTLNLNRFPNLGPRTMDYMALLGYAVVEPDAPIVGPSGRMNDNYVPDIRNNLSAVIDELDRQSIIDRQRLAAGGHSYGAFSTVNAMVQTPFFRAGIAGDGNYNRTLTPNGFQTERRNLWEARELYTQMSPFFYADRMQGALLMYHGEDDQNVGTAPENSTRLFHALQGLGKPVSLYMYPYEDHGPATRETLLDLWARWVTWLDVYVKDADTKPRTSPVQAMDEGL